MLLDTTLREGEQSFGTYLSMADRERVLRGLAAVGVPEAEVGWAGRDDLADMLALSARAAACLTPAQRRALEQHTTLLPLAVPTIELAGGSVRCMLAGIHLAPRPSMAPASREASATSTNLIQIGT